MNSITKLVKNNLCTGCGACAGVFSIPAANMSLSAEGFLRPIQSRPLNQTESDLFNKICPGAGLSHLGRDRSFLDIWGPMQGVMAGNAADDEVRFKGSSGGVLSALAIYLLETGAVQGVVHIAPATEDPFENLVQLSTTRDDVLRAAGSRYAPASPLSDINNYLVMPGQFAFIGKPCDVAALRALQRESPEMRQKFPYLLSFMCAGTPSMKGTEAVVRHMGFAPDDVRRFRYRGNGWPGVARAETKAGQSAEMDYEASWGQILNRYLQFRCKICPDGTGEFSDITCADAWHGDERGYPSFEESAGRSLILGRTKKGADLVREAISANVIKAEQLNASEIMRMQPYQVTRKQALIARLIGARLAMKHIPKFNNMGLVEAARMMPLKLHVRNALGTWLRTIKARQ